MSPSLARPTLSSLVLIGLLATTAHCALPGATDSNGDERDATIDGLTVAPAAPSGAVAPAPAPLALVSVDCGRLDAAESTHVRYARGWVQPIDYSSSPSEVASNVATARGMSPTMTTAVFDLNTRANAPMFQLDATASLVPSSTDLGFAERLRAVKAAGLRTFVQLSGTPAAAPASWLDDEDYVSRENANGNFYPLPRAANVGSVQRAIIDSILATERAPGLGGNVWLGTQEPTHTIGFAPTTTDGSTPCADADVSREEKLACRKDNIRRFIAYWRPIAKALRRNNVKVGGIQLNSHDRDLYAFAADEIIATGTPIDTFTIQRYSSHEDLVPNAHAAYQRFQRAPGYENVKIAFNRYSFDNGETAESRRAFFASAEGMVQILRDEKQIMEHAAMMEGYAYQTGGILESTSLVPTILSWLKAAPAPLRTVTIEHAAEGLESFALVSTGDKPHASIAVWNRGSTTQDVALVLARTNIELGAKQLYARKGSGTTIQPVRVRLRQGRIEGLSLGPNELALVDAE